MAAKQENEVSLSEIVVDFSFYNTPNVSVNPDSPNMNDFVAFTSIVFSNNDYSD